MTFLTKLLAQTILLIDSVLLLHSRFPVMRTLDIGLGGRDCEYSWHPIILMVFTFLMTVIPC